METAAAQARAGSSQHPLWPQCRVRLLQVPPQQIEASVCPHLRQGVKAIPVTLATHFSAKPLCWPSLELAVFGMKDWAWGVLTRKPPLWKTTQD